MNFNSKGVTKNCRYCNSVLIKGENIRPSAVLRYDWVCSECRKEYRKDNERRDDE